MRTRPNPIGPAQADDLPSAHGSWIHRHTILPLLALLRLGSSPERLAWSLAAGVLIGINPVLGSTTVICLIAAFLFRLNIPASQIGTHAMYPLELALLVPFLHVGTRVFGTAQLSMSTGAMLDAAKHAPLDLLRQIWMWEWHALIVWAVFAVMAVPVLACLLTPILRRLLQRVNCGGVPSVSGL